jgi:hypothetical protein
MTSMSPTSPPQHVALLGYGGLLPFMAFGAAIIFFPEDSGFAARALLAYGAVILSFVGALHWGFAMNLQELSEQQRLQAYLWSVIPALLAWPALVIDSEAMGSALLVAGFLANFWRDVCLTRVVVLPDWYLPLRLRLTAVACLCLLALLVTSVA